MIAQIPTGSQMDSYLIWWIFSSAGRQLYMIYLFLQTTSWTKATPLAGKLLKAVVTNRFTIFASKVWAWMHAWLKWDVYHIFCNFIVPILKIFLGPVKRHWIYEYLIIPWSRFLLEKLTGFQLVKKFPVFYGTRRFITTFTCACYLSLSWASSIQSKLPHPSSWRSILILSRVFQVVKFPQVSPPKPCILLSSPP